MALAPLPNDVALKVCDDLSDDGGWRGFVVAITGRHVIVSSAMDGLEGPVRRIRKTEAFGLRAHWIANHPEEVESE